MFCMLFCEKWHQASQSKNISPNWFVCCLLKKTKNVTRHANIAQLSLDLSFELSYVLFLLLFSTNNSCHHVGQKKKKNTQKRVACTFSKSKKKSQKRVCCHKKKKKNYCRISREFAKIIVKKRKKQTSQWKLNLSKICCDCE